MIGEKENTIEYNLIKCEHSKGMNNRKSHKKKIGCKASNIGRYKKDALYSNYKLAV